MNKASSSIKISVVAMLVAALVSACGGGGSGGAASSTSPVGVWQGTSSSGYQLDLMVLPNGKFYNLYGTMSGNTFSIYGFDVGTYSGNIAGTVTDYYYAGGIYSGSLTGSATSSSISGSATYTNGVTTTFSLSPLSSYTFNTSASLNNILGAWSGQTLNGTPASVSVASGGAFTGSSGGCSFSGQTTPSASGENYFDTTLTFGSSPCVNPGQTYSGITIEYPTNTGRNQLNVIVTNSGNSSGYLFLAQR